MGEKIRTSLGLILLAAQVYGIGLARFIPERYFCWGPYDQCH